MLFRICHYYYMWIKPKTMPKYVVKVVNATIANKIKIIRDSVKQPVWVNRVRAFQYISSNFTRHITVTSSLVTSSKHSSDKRKKIHRLQSMPLVDKTNKHHIANLRRFVIIKYFFANLIDIIEWYVDRPCPIDNIKQWICFLPLVFPIQTWSSSIPTSVEPHIKKTRQ